MNYQQRKAIDPPAKRGARIPSPAEKHGDCKRLSLETIYIVYPQTARDIYENSILDFPTGTNVSLPTTTRVSSNRFAPTPFGRTTIGHTITYVARVGQEDVRAGSRGVFSSGGKKYPQTSYIDFMKRLFRNKSQSNRLDFIRFVNCSARARSLSLSPGNKTRCGKADSILSANGISSRASFSGSKSWPVGTHDTRTVRVCVCFNITVLFSKLCTRIYK